MCNTKYEKFLNCFKMGHLTVKVASECGREFITVNIAHFNTLNIFPSGMVNILSEETQFSSRSLWFCEFLYKME